MRLRTLLAGLALAGLSSLAMAQEPVLATALDYTLNASRDVPVGCKIYHDLGVQYGVPTPIIDSMIVLAGAMHKKSFFETSKYNLAYIGIDKMPKEELLDYLNKGIYKR